MDSYYVNQKAETSGEHEVHKASCKYLPKKENLMPLGEFAKCSDALKEAKKHYSNIDGCYFCCLLYHKR